MKSASTPLPGVRIITPTRHQDDRGWFMETYRADTGPTADLPLFVQDNHSCSHRGVLRGLHYQLQHPQGKLVRVTRGAAWDVAVDLRPDSPTHGEWFGTRLDAKDGSMLWIPEGMAHGFLALQDDTHLLYKCTASYAPGDERGIRWDDPDLAIDWPHEAPIVSDRDAALPFLRDADLP